MLLIFGMIYGGFFGYAYRENKAYCECFRSNFQGAYCESIKGKGEPKTCELKK
jgi:hypothetical protein